MFGQTGSAARAGQLRENRVDVLVEGPVDGRSPGEWTAQWWRWALRQRIEPFLDPDGRFCELGQVGPVWFLAGTDGSFASQRGCAVPEGRYRLVPVINMMAAARQRHAACATPGRGGGEQRPPAQRGVALLNGRSLGNLRMRRVRSDGCFRLDPANPSSRLGAADGSCSDRFRAVATPWGWAPTTALGKSAAAPCSRTSNTCGTWVAAWGC